MNDSVINKLLLVSSISLALGLVGCGGSSSVGVTGDSTVDGVTFAGKAAKGIIVAGQVTGNELNSDGTVLAIVGTTTTDLNGEYTLALTDYSGGPVEISIASDTNTLMKCDVAAGCGTRTDTVVDANLNTDIDFGELYYPGALTMTALVPDASASATVSVNVTPFTHMAAERAKTQGGLTAAVVAVANSEVSNLLGINILETEPVDITDPAAVSATGVTPTQVTYAALASTLASFGTLDADNQPDLNDALDLLATSFSGGTLLADDTDSATDDAQISLQEIIGVAGETFLAAGEDDQTTVLATLEEVVAVAEAGDGTVTTSGSSTAADPDLVKGKALVAEVRTWSNVILADYNTAAVTPFDTQVQLASDAAGVIDSEVFEVLSNAVAAALEYDNTTFVVAGALSEVQSAEESLTGNPLMNFTAGTIGRSGNVVTIVGGMYLGYTVSLGFELPVDMAGNTAFEIGIDSVIIEKPGVNRLFISEGTVVVGFDSTYMVNYEALDLGTALDAPKINQFDFDLTAELTQDVAADGTALTSPVTFSGSLVFDLAVKTLANVDAVAPNDDTFAVPGSIVMMGSISDTNSNNSGAITLTVNVANAGTVVLDVFAPEGTLYSAGPNRTSDFVSWAYTDADALSGNDTFTITSLQGTLAIYWDNTSGGGDVYVNGGFVGGTFGSLGAYLATIGVNNVYVYVDGEGAYFADLVSLDPALFAVDGTADGVLVDDVDFVAETTGNFIDADVSLNFTAQLTGLPEATINISADRDTLTQGNASMTLSYNDSVEGNRTISMVAPAIVKDSGEVSGALTITNQDGTILSIDPLAANDLTVSGTVTVDAVTVGTLTETATGLIKVTYTDGLFEVF